MSKEEPKQPIHLLRRLTDKLSANWLRRIINLWSPFRGAGIKIQKISPDFRYVEVSMQLHWYNRNYLGTHFGGSIFAMTDAFYVIMLIRNLGSGYIVWDKAAHIDYKKPGRGTLHVVFTLSEDEIQLVRNKADQNDKYVFDRSVDVLNEQGEVVASVIKTIYVRKKPKKDI